MSTADDLSTPARPSLFQDDEVFSLEPTAPKTTAGVTLEGDDIVLSRWRLGEASPTVDRIPYSEWKAKYDIAAVAFDGSEADDETGLDPADEAVLLLQLGWRVSCTPTAAGATVVATPQVDGSVDVDAQWRSLDLEPGSSIQLSWRRSFSSQESWIENQDETGVRDSIGDFVALDGETLDALKFLLAPRWTSTAFSSDREGWHSNNSHTAASFLASDFLADTNTADSETVKSLVDTTHGWALDHGMVGPFNSVKDVVTQLDESKQPLVGYYLVSLTNGKCYVGETVNFRNRLATHQRTFGDGVRGFYVRPDSTAANLSSRKTQKEHLHVVERKLIHDVQDAKLVAMNFQEMAHPISEFAGFADEIAPRTAEEWFTDPVAANVGDGYPLRPLQTHQHGGKQSKFSTLTKMTEAADILGIVHDYLTRCMPYPTRTEMVSWSLSCLPGAQRGERGARSNVLACLSVSMTEVLTLLQETKSQQCWGFLAVNDVELGQDDDLQFIRLLRRHPGIDISPSRYREFGPGVSMIYAPDLAALRRLLDDVEVTRAAATVALRLCRMGPARQTNVHNPYLVEAALGQERQWT